MRQLDKIESITKVLIESRESKNKSQRWMAKALRKSPTTISNWEEGISVPNLLDILDWFEVLGENPAQYILKFVDKNFDNLDNFEDDEINKRNLIEFIENVATPSIRKKLAFNILGNTGSFFGAQMDLMTAHNLCTLDVKVNNAWMIFHHYIMAKNRGELIRTDITPNEQLLYDTITKGENAAFDKKEGYVASK